MKKFLAMVLALIMALSLVACGQQGGDAQQGDDSASGDKVIKIGVFEPQSGDNGAGGKQEILGMQYANKMIPTVTIGGEDGISPDEAVERARREADPDTRSLPPGAYVRINLNIAPGQTLTSAQETEIRQAIDEAGCTYVLSNIRVARHEADGEGSAPLSVAEFRRLTPQDVAIDYCRRTGCSLTDEQMALFNEVVDLVREPGGDDDENDEK